MKKLMAAALSLSLMTLSCFTAYGEKPPGSHEQTNTPFGDPLPPIGISHAAPLLTLQGGTLRHRLVNLPASGEPYLPAFDPFLDGDEEYEETPARRFEIIFFISMPVTLGLSFAGIAAYRLAAGTWGSFDNTDYAYLVLSTVSLSLSVALHDNRVVYRKRGT
jgi:hypothetical protein